MSKEYQKLQQELFAWLQQFEKTKKQGKEVEGLACKIGGTIHQEISSLVQTLDQLMENVLRLEQETREI